VYGSVPVDPETRSRLCWPTSIWRDGARVTARDRAALGDGPLVEAMEMGFMGLFLPRAVLDTVGYPDPSLFTKADDVEYYLRMRRAGVRMFYVTGSVLTHPAAQYATPWPFGRFWTFPVLPQPWQEYYLARNSMYLWLEYDGRLRGVLLHLPALLLRVLYALVWRDRKWERCSRQLHGVLDGLRGRLGRTVLPA
jgi:GT2 family glycosyltransferase